MFDLMIACSLIKFAKIIPLLEKVNHNYVTVHILRIVRIIIILLGI